MHRAYHVSKLGVLILSQLAKVFQSYKRESLFYLSLLIEHEKLNTPEFIQLRQLLLSWQKHWSIIISQSAEIAFVSATSVSWSDRILNMSALLTSETESV